MTVFKIHRRTFTCHGMVLRSLNADCMTRGFRAFSRPVIGSGKTTTPARAPGGRNQRTIEPVVRWLFPALDGRLVTMASGNAVLAPTRGAQAGNWASARKLPI